MPLARILRKPDTACGAREPRKAMTLELRILALSVVLGLVQIVLASHAASLQRGYRWTAGSRDQAVPRLTGMAGRLERALRNFVETFPLFAAAVLIAHVTNTHSWMTDGASNSTLGLVSPTSPCMRRVYFSCAHSSGTWRPSGSRWCSCHSSEPCVCRRTC